MTRTVNGENEEKGGIYNLTDPITSAKITKQYPEKDM